MKKIPFVTTVICFLITFSLGIWQLVRLDEKTKIINKIETVIKLPCEKSTCKNITNLWNSNQDIMYKKFTVKGKVKKEEILFLYAGPMQFKGNNGYKLIAPLHCKDGEKLIIDLGWVPDKTRKDYLKDYNGKFNVSLLKSEQQKTFTPNNEPNHNMWYFISSNEIGNHFKTKFPDFYLMKAKSDNHYPIGKNVTPNIRNDHLNYAITWFMLAIGILAIYIIYQRKNGKLSKTH